MRSVVLSDSECPGEADEQHNADLEKANALLQAHLDKDTPRDSTHADRTVSMIAEVMSAVGGPDVFFDAQQTPSKTTAHRHGNGSRASTRRAVAASEASRADTQVQHSSSAQHAVPTHHTRLAITGTTASHRRSTHATIQRDAT